MLLFIEDNSNSRVDQGLFEAFRAMPDSPKEVELAGEKERFFEARSSGEEYIPQFRFILDEEVTRTLYQRDVALDRLQRDIQRNDHGADIQWFYQGIIEDARNRNQRIAASGAGNWEEFNNAGQRLYGIPRESVYTHVMQGLYKDAQDVVDGSIHASEIKKQLAQEWLDHLKDHQIEKTNLDISLAPTVVDALRANLLSAFAPFLTTIPPKETGQLYTAAEIVEVFNAGFFNAGISQNPLNWQAEISNRKLMKVSTATQRVLVPVTKTASSEELVDDIIQEATHIVAGVNGKRSPFGLLGLGTAGYIVANEAISTIAAKLVAGKAVDLGTPYRFVGLGYALGLGTGKHRTFPEVYEFLNKMYRFREADMNIQPESLEILTVKALDKAWSFTANVFRGTDGKNAVNHRSAVHVEGRYRVLEAFKKKPELLAISLLGKYDFTDESQLIRLRRMGALPDELMRKACW